MKKTLCALLTLTCIGMHAVIIENKLEEDIIVQVLVFTDRREIWMLPVTLAPGSTWEKDGIETIQVTTQDQSFAQEFDVDDQTVISIGSINGKIAATIQDFLHPLS